MPPQPSTPSPTPGPYHHPRPLYPLLAAWIVGVAAGDRWPDFAPTAVAVAAVGVLGSVAGICSRRGGRWQPAALFFALGFLSIQPWNRSAPGSAFIGPFLDGGVCTVTGTVSDRPRRYPGRTRFILRVERLAGWTDTADRHRARLRVTVNGEDPGLRRGDRIRLSGRIRSFHNFDNPGGFDYRRYMRHRRVAGSISLWGGRPTLIRKKERSSLAALGSPATAVFRRLHHDSIRLPPA